MFGMSWLRNAWPTVATISAVIVGLAAFVQTTLSILKSRYELKKLRADDEKLRKKRSTRYQELKDEGLLLYERSEYYHRKLAREWARWIVLIVFLLFTGMFYSALSMAILDQKEMIDEKKQEVATLKQANESLGDCLTVAHSLKRALERNRRSSP
jgi:hypothetical protein